MTTKTKKKNRGGRKPGVWSLITQDQLKSWRQSSGVSRLRVARALGVSPTSVQNWEVGLAIPATSNQQKLVEIMKSPERIPAKANGTPFGGFTPISSMLEGVPVVPAKGDLTNVVGTIVASYVSSGPVKLTPEELPVLVRSVRSALVG